MAFTYPSVVSSGTKLFDLYYYDYSIDGYYFLDSLYAADMSGTLTINAFDAGVIDLTITNADKFYRIKEKMETGFVIINREREDDDYASNTFFWLTSNQISEGMQDGAYSIDYSIGGGDLKWLLGRKLLRNNVYYLDSDLPVDPDSGAVTIPEDYLAYNVTPGVTVGAKAIINSTVDLLEDILLTSIGGMVRDVYGKSVKNTGSTGLLGGNIIKKSGGGTFNSVSSKCGETTILSFITENKYPMFPKVLLVGDTEKRTEINISGEFSVQTLDLNNFDVSPVTYEETFINEGLINSVFVQGEGTTNDMFLPKGAPSYVPFAYEAISSNSDGLSSSEQAEQLVESNEKVDDLVITFDTKDLSKMGGVIVLGGLYNILYNGLDQNKIYRIESIEETYGENVVSAAVTFVEKI